jgi:hypothetical protein
MRGFAMMVPKLLIFPAGAGLWQLCRIMLV